MLLVARLHSSSRPGRGSGAPPVEQIPTRRLGQVPAFDGLRGIAVMIVIVAHLNVILPIPHLLVVPGGTVSLDSFFVLSGFLITTLLLREQARSGRVDKLAFYRRRALRLLPALFAMVLVYAIYAFAAGIRFHDVWTSLLSVSLYYSNWKLALHSNAFGGFIAPGLQHMWSLSVEEQFYLIWPWVTVLVLTIRRSFRTVVIVLASLIVLVAIHRAVTYHGLTNWYATFIRTDTRADSILIGCLAAHIWIRGREPKRWIGAAGWVAAAFLIVCIALAELTGPFLYRGGLVAIDLACAVLILAILNGRWRGRRFFELKPLVILGVVSYALYLWHLPVFFAVQHYGPHWPGVTKVVVATGLTFAFTGLSWVLLERPAMRWKDRLESRQRADGERLQAPPALEPHLTAPGGVDRRAGAGIARGAGALGPSPGVTGGGA